jgi:glycosyltransferase involved in cell wall biosynthesis
VSRIAIASTYPPRQCGIATFTADLGRGIGAREVVALRGPDDQSRFDAEVHHVIRTDVRADHTRVARSLDDCSVQVVSVQHDYATWGGDEGEYVLDFLTELSMPSVATLHSVLSQPSALQRRIMLGILASTDAVVVMSQAAASVLAQEYDADPRRIEVIAHGVPDLPLVEPDSIKPAVGMAGRTVLLSFGLLGPGKGCETVIKAMPAVVRAVPNATYVIVGATDPVILRASGEAYRRSLEALAGELGMNDHVVFVDRFVGRLELSRWLEAADVFVTPYPDLDRTVAGTLAYAMAAGKASVSTPYRYASETLADGRGLLVPPASASAMSDALVTLLSDPALRASMSARAYQHGRGMIWSQVTAAYARLFDRLAVVPRASAYAALPARRI